jgi:hypothetical protein
VLATTRSLYNMYHTGAICLLIDAAIIVGGLLVALLAPLMSGFGAILSTLDGDATLSFYGAFRGINRSMKRL